MTKKNLWLGILALTLVLGMTVVGCSDGSTDGKGGNNNSGNNGGNNGGNNDNSSGGTFTLTGIPSEYNGKYAVLEAAVVGEGVEAIVGAQTVNMSTGTITAPVISNGSVSIPLWTSPDSGEGVIRYSGNQTLYVAILITNIQSGDEGDFKHNYVAFIEFSSVASSNGSVTKSWSQGRVQTPQ